MATPQFHFPVTAAQVGTYFVGHYYQVLQTQPNLVHHFYSDRSTLLRIDGHSRETATSMLQIHALVMSFNYTGIEIKSVHALESWDNGVLVLVSGSVHRKDYTVRRNFVQTFFLAPQEKGYFVLNDIFNFIDDNQPSYHHPVAYLTPNDYLPPSSYMPGGDIQVRDFVTPPTIVEENGYTFQEQQLQQAPEVDNSIENNNYSVQSNGSVKNSVTPVEEPVGEPQKHTYASILQVAKGQSASSVPREPAVMREPPVTKTATPIEPERYGSEDTSGVEDEVELKSVYVRNLPLNVMVSEIEEEFKKFGKLRQDGVAIRTRKDIDVCYAFVEFKDMTGVHNAIKASTVEISGQQVYIEGRRANRSGNAYRGGRGRGRGRSGHHQTEGRGGRYGGKNYAKTNGGQNGDYTRPRSNNGYYRQGPRGYSNSREASGNGHTPSH